MKNVFHMGRSFEIIKTINPNESLSCTDVAKKTDVSWSQCSKILPELIKAGYLEVERKDEDMRNKLVKLSKSGLVLHYVVYELFSILNKYTKGDGNGEKK
jgi:DNA-binding MarR family transcriptional regulator